MALLFLNSRGPDYIEDQLFAGLTRLLGRELVMPYPVNKEYYLPHKPYPRNLGHSRNLADYLRDQILVRRKLKSREFDAVIIGSTKKDTFERYRDLLPDLPVGIPVIYIDGGDWPEVGGDAKRMGFHDLLAETFSRRPPSLVFKREYLIGKDYGANVHPLPMAFGPAPELGMVEKKYGVSCWCVESDPIRTQALSLLEDSYDCRANGTIRGQKFRTYKRKGAGYLRELAASRIACNFRGVGWDTLRYWEIPGVGTFMLSQQPRIVIPNNFIQQEHVVFCRDDLTDMLDMLDYFLRHDNEREEMALAAKSFAKAKHSYLNRAEYVIDIMQPTSL
ncbi:MAG: glycosyltransferase [Thiohalomonadaceae bacterium]